MTYYPGIGVGHSLQQPDHVSGMDAYHTGRLVGRHGVLCGGCVTEDAGLALTAVRETKSHPSWRAYHEYAGFWFEPLAFDRI